MKRKMVTVMLMPLPAVAKDLPEVEFVAGLHVGPHARHLLDHHLHLEVKNLTEVKLFEGEKSLHREVFKLWSGLDNPREGAVPELRGEVEADIFRLPIKI